MQRGRSQQEEKLISAVGNLLEEEGYAQLRINKIAQRAGVNKVLIYRYFGGLDGLINAYFTKERPFVSAPPIDLERLKNAPLEDFFEACYDYLIAEFRLLRQNVAAQEFLKADLLHKSGNTNPIAAEKEKQLREMVDGLASVIGTKDGQGFAALLISALTLLTFSAQQEKVVFGIDLKTDEGWARIEAALANIFRGAYLYTKERLAAEQSVDGPETV